MLTDPNDLVIDPFAGSCVTGEVSERLKRRWACIELSEEYLHGALGRFVPRSDTSTETPVKEDGDENYYKLARPGVLWNGNDDLPLAKDGGKTRRYTSFTEESLAVSPGEDEVSSSYAQQGPHLTLWKGVHETQEALETHEKVD